MIVRMRLRKWDDCFEGAGFKVDIKTPSIGFLEVYDSVDALHKEYPGEINYAEITSAIQSTYIAST